jgi:tetratricopeptide (TPR) repeat protein
MFVACMAAMLMPLAMAQTPPTPALVVEGTVCDANGKPVANAEVRLEEPGKPGVIAQTDSSGAFAISVLDRGSYTIVADKSGLHSLSRAVPLIPSGERKHFDLVLDQRGMASAAPTAPSTSSPMEFADQPNFTVAGVIDWTAVGGHGSDATLRTSEALARETLTLKPQGDATSAHSDGASSASNDRADLERTREAVKRLLAQRETAELHLQLGELDEKLADPLAAVREYEQAVRLEASEQNYFAWGSELLLHRAVWQAAEVFANGAKAYPGSARMLTALGTSLFASARYDEAALRICEASDLAPADAEPYLIMGKIEMAAPSPLPCVEERLARFVKQQPNDALANYFYAMAIRKRQEVPPSPHDEQEVEALLNSAVTIDTKCADAYLQLGLLHFSRRDYNKAIFYYTEAIAAVPELGEAHYRLGVAYDRIGEADKAKQEFQLHDEIEKAQLEAIERQRREVKQFLVVLQGQSAAQPVH